MTVQRSRSHKDLVVWRKALELAVQIHRLTEHLPRYERFGLVSQLRRAAVSVPSNIAEGAARRTTRDFLAFLHVARGSVAELETQLLLAQEFGYVESLMFQDVMARLDEVGRLVNGVIAGLHRRLQQNLPNR
jgi:four helix bundle protein